MKLESMSDVEATVSQFQKILGEKRHNLEIEGYDDIAKAIGRALAALAHQAAPGNHQWTILDAEIDYITRQVFFRALKRVHVLYEDNQTEVERWCLDNNVFDYLRAWQAESIEAVALLLDDDTEYSFEKLRHFNAIYERISDILVRACPNIYDAVIDNDSGVSQTNLSLSDAFANIGLLARKSLFWIGESFKSINALPVYAGLFFAFAFHLSDLSFAGKNVGTNMLQFGLVFLIFSFPIFIFLRKKLFLGVAYSLLAILAGLLAPAFLNFQADVKWENVGIIIGNIKDTGILIPSLLIFAVCFLALLQYFDRNGKS